MNRRESPVTVEGYGPSIAVLVNDCWIMLDYHGLGDEIAGFRVYDAGKWGWHVVVPTSLRHVPRGFGLKATI